MRGIGRSLWLLLSRFCSKDVVLLPFVHLYLTLTSPGAGRQTETALNVRHGNLTPPRISPSCPHENGWTGVSLLPDGIIARQLVQLFCERMGTARHLTLAVFYAGNPHRWVLAHPPESLSAFGGPSGNVFQSPDMTGSARCFSRCAGGTGQPPHYLSRVREGVARKNFNFPSFF